MSTKKVSRAWKGAAAGLAVAGVVAGSLAGLSNNGAAAASGNLAAGFATATPIKHVVVIFDENISYDHYFGTYPYAANTDGTRFTAK